MQEIFKEVPKFPNYQVSNLGRVKSFNKNKEIFLKTVNNKGYLQVVLYENKKAKTIQVHRLVAITFLNHVSDISSGIVIDHINNNRQDNRLENLQLVTVRLNNSKDRKGGASDFIGVFWSVKHKKWGCAIFYKKRRIHLGLFYDELEAANAYNKALVSLEQGADLNLLYPKEEKTSKYKGVDLNKRSGRWRARVPSKHIGYFDTELEAYNAYNYWLQNNNKSLN
jgi:hypothetical protein